MSKNISKQLILLEKVLKALAFYKLGKMWSRGLRTKLGKVSLFLGLLIVSLAFILMLV